MSNKTYRVFLEKLGGTSANNFVGTQGELFFDPEDPILRVANGAPGGTTISGGGGSVSGNISISSTNSAINFVANSSGDGLGYSTIELRPDLGATSDQYLIIDPTEPGHIHVRSGGTEYNSLAQLFLGGEESFFRVDDTNGVRMQRTQNESVFAEEYNSPADFTNGSWFTEGSNSFIRYTTSNTDLADHSTELDNNRENYVTVYWANGGFSQTFSYGGSSYDEGGGVYKVQVNSAPDGNTPVTFTSMYWDLHAARSNYAEVTSGDFRVDVRGNVRLTGRDTVSLRNWSNTSPINIITRYDDLDYTWSFNANSVLTLAGSIEFPDDSIQTGAAISISNLKTLVANCATFDDFKTAIAAL